MISKPCYSKTSQIRQPPLPVTPLIGVIPGATGIKNQNHRQPDQVHAGQSESKMIRTEIKRRRLGMNIRCGVMQHKKQDDGEQVNQINMHDVIEERHPSKHLNKTETFF